MISVKNVSNYNDISNNYNRITFRNNTTFQGQNNVTFKAAKYNQNDVFKQLAKIFGVLLAAITSSLSINKNNQKYTETHEMMKDFIVVRSNTGEVAGYIKGDLTVRSAFYEPGNSYFDQIQEEELTNISEFYNAAIKKNPNLSKYKAYITLHNGRKPLVTASFKKKKAWPWDKKIYRKGEYNNGQIKIDLNDIK